MRGWLADQPPQDGPYQSSLRLTFDWPGGFVVLPALGLVVGVVVALVLHRAGWRLRRG